MNKQGLLLLPEERSCAGDGGWNSTSLGWRSSAACNLAGEAGRGKGAARKGRPKDKRAALNTWRGGIAEMKGRKRLYDLQAATCSL